VYHILPALSNHHRAWQTHDLIARLGAGIIIGHPESIIRTLKLNDDKGGFINKGYYLSGATIQIAAEKRWQLNPHIFLGIEAKLTASYARNISERVDRFLHNTAIAFMLSKVPLSY